MATLDAFGEVRWARPVPARWQRQARCLDGNAGCAFKDRQGVSYQHVDGGLIDKELVVRNGAKLPWGLAPADTPPVVRNKLEAISGSPTTLGERDGHHTVELMIVDCQAWIEVWFDGTRGIRSISINAQP